MRIGQGFDVHAFAADRKLVLGGVEIPHEKGLAGHSDADVVIHALCDALLGAAALGDIGQHFPGTAEYKNMDSRILLRRVMEMITASGYVVNNVDITVIAQAPRLTTYISQMRTNLASDMGVEILQVSVKATTTDNLGFTGRKEGIAAMVVVIVKENLR